MSDYIVRYGMMRFLGIFTAADGNQYRRGANVIARTDRGLEEQMGQRTCVPLDCYEDVLVIVETSASEPDAPTRDDAPIRDAHPRDGAIRETEPPARDETADVGAREADAARATVTPRSAGDSAESAVVSGEGDPDGTASIAGPVSGAGVSVEAMNPAAVPVPAASITPGAIGAELPQVQVPTGKEASSPQGMPTAPSKTSSSDPGGPPNGLRMTRCEVVAPKPNWFST